MKRWIPIFTVVNSVLLLAFFLYTFFNTSKIAYVDSNKLINGYQGMVRARTEYKAKLAVWKSNIDTLVKDVQSEISKYNNEKPRMSARERELSEKLIITKKQQLADYQKATNDKASQEDAAATRKVIDEINAFIKEYGKIHGYTIVLAATDYGNIAFAKENLDLTGKILDELNKNYSKGTDK
jgi:outer membrane protein